MIKVTRRQYAIISRIYRFGGFAVILGLLTAFSCLIGKPIEFLLIFLPYFFTKGLYPKQFHARSLHECFILSLIVFSLAAMACVPCGTSITFAFVIGMAIAFISYKCGVVQSKIKDYEYIEPRYNKLVEFYKKSTEPKNFNVDTCSEDELKERCRGLHLSEENTKLAVEFFIRKTKQSIIADELCIDEKSVTTRKKRLKEKLNKN